MSIESLGKTRVYLHISNPLNLSPLGTACGNSLPQGSKDPCNAMHQISFFFRLPSESVGVYGNSVSWATITKRGSG